MPIINVLTTKTYILFNSDIKSDVNHDSWQQLIHFINIKLVLNFVITYDSGRRSLNGT